MLPFNVFNYPKQQDENVAEISNDLYELLSSGADIQTNDPVMAQVLADIVPGLSVVLVPDDPDDMDETED